MVTDVAKAARRINGSRNISRGISESSIPRISRDNSCISRGISRNNSSIIHGISESSSPRISSNISSGPSNISNVLCRSLLLKLGNPFSDIRCRY